MRVFYRAVQGMRRIAHPVYEAVRVVPCCESMERQWERLIAFGVVGCPRSTSRDVNLAVSVPQANGKPILEVVPVTFCPWCGSPIEPCRVK